MRNPTDPTLRLTDAISLNAPDLLRYFQRRLNSEDAADAVADVMTTGWRRVNALPVGPEHARMWLFGIARHVVASESAPPRPERDTNARERTSKPHSRPTLTRKHSHALIHAASSLRHNQSNDDQLNRYPDRPSGHLAAANRID
jgi:DNA-directed RNA polymerase specialized sigma24 family protein